MKPFERAELPPEAFDVEATMKKFGCTEEAARAMVLFNHTQEVWLNDKYQVNVRPAEVLEGCHPMIWLSIKRIDKEAIHDWRDLQKIKNMIVGPEHEAVEIYPAESRLIDTANQYHLWVFKDPDLQFPFGFFDGRAVSGPEKVAATGGKQRPFT